MEHSVNDDVHPAELEINGTGYSRLADLETETGILRRGDFICDLSHLGFATASGPDAAEFLHRQLTNDLKNLGSDDSELTGYCTNKGRLLCIFRVHRGNGDVILQAGKPVLTTTLETIRRYILRAKVTLDAREDIQSFGVFGKDSSQALALLTGAIPDRVDGVSSCGGITVIRHAPAAAERYQVIGPTAALGNLWRELSGSCPVTGSWSWAAYDINQGRPAIFEQTAGEFLPHSVNMDLLNAVSFRKGCYPGQEIVARMHYRGKPKSRMIHARLDSGPTPAPGDKIYVEGNEQSIGMLVDVAPSEPGYDVLTTIKLEYLEEGNLMLAGPTGARITRGKMPYSLDDDRQHDTR